MNIPHQKIKKEKEKTTVALEQNAEDEALVTTTFN